MNTNISIQTEITYEKLKSKLASDVASVWNFNLNKYNYIVLFKIFCDMSHL